MATKQASMLYKPVYHGEEGNQSKAGGDYTFAADASGTIIQLRKLPLGTKITGVEYVNAALGTSVTLNIAVGATTLISALACASAGNGYRPVTDVTLTADSFLTLTVGGAAATGAVTVRVIYEFVGNL